MKIILFFIIIVLLLGSCHNNHEVATESAQANHIPTIHLAGQAYRFGPVLNDTTCKVEAACDCCASDILFTDENHFIALFLCLQDDTYAHGSYRIDGDKVYLNYEGKKVDFVTDMQQVYDSLAHLDSVYSSSKYEVGIMPHSIDTLTAFLCRGMIGFRSNQLDNGLPCGSPALSLEEMRKDSILQMMEFK